MVFVAGLVSRQRMIGFCRTEQDSDDLQRDIGAGGRSPLRLSVAEASDVVLTHQGKIALGLASERIHKAGGGALISLECRRSHGWAKLRRNP